MNGYDTIEKIRKELQEAKLQAKHGNKQVAYLCMRNVRRLIDNYSARAIFPDFNFRERKP